MLKDYIIVEAPIFILIFIFLSFVITFEMGLGALIGTLVAFVATVILAIGILLFFCLIWLWIIFAEKMGWIFND